MGARSGKAEPFRTEGGKAAHCASTRLPSVSYFMRGGLVYNRKRKIFINYQGVPRCPSRQPTQLRAKLSKLSKRSVNLKSTKSFSLQRRPLSPIATLHLLNASQCYCARRKFWKLRSTTLPA